MLKLTILLTPPSQNHYMRYRVATINGHAQVIAYPDKEAKLWWKAVAAVAAKIPERLEADAYEVAYIIYQGHNERGDVDNYGKCILDAIVKAGVIDSDHKVFAMHAYKARDRQRPRTEIFIRPMGQLPLIDLPMPTMAAVADDNW